MENKQIDFRNMETSSLLNWIEKKYNEWDVLSDEDGELISQAREEALKREPFFYLKEEFDEFKKKVDGMQRAIDKLKRHKHLEGGEIVIPL